MLGAWKREKLVSQKKTVSYYEIVLRRQRYKKYFFFQAFSNFYFMFFMQNSMICLQNGDSLEPQRTVYHTFSENVYLIIGDSL